MTIRGHLLPLIQEIEIPVCDGEKVAVENS